MPIAEEHSDDDDQGHEGERHTQTHEHTGREEVGEHAHPSVFGRIRRCVTDVVEVAPSTRPLG